MDDFNIEVFPASYGESLLVSCGISGERVHILIDTGFVETYNKHLKKRLIELGKKGDELELLVITHIDADHVAGSIGLFRDNGGAGVSKIIRIKEVWHNGYRNLKFIKKEPNEGELEQRELLESIAEMGYPEQLSDEDEVDVPISGEQGATLASYLRDGRYSWNSKFGGAEICADELPRIQLGPDIAITILSPNSGDLQRLAKYIKDELSEKGYRCSLYEDEIFDDVFEVLSAQEDAQHMTEEVDEDIAYTAEEFEDLIHNEFEEDNSESNGSSISFILEFRGKRVLFLGDSYPSVIERNLKRLFPNVENEPLFFDAIKVSHHGSKHNTSPTLLKLVDSGKYIISTNGMQHGHPDVETLARIVCRENGVHRRLVFNYPVSALTLLRDDELQRRYNYTVETNSGKHSVLIQI